MQQYRRKFLYVCPHCENKGFKKYEPYADHMKQVHNESVVKRADGSGSQSKSKKS